MPAHTLSPSPFSASEVQKTPLFGQKAQAKFGETKIKATLESSLVNEDLITAMRAPVAPLKVASCAEAKLAASELSSRQVSESPLLIGSTAFPDLRQPTKEEEEEEEFGELSSYDSSVSQASAVSIEPKASTGGLHITGDGPHLGFWADVGASTLDLEPVKEGTWLADSDFSDWECESEDDEEEVLLPWDT